MSGRTPLRSPSHGQGYYGQFQFDLAQPPDRGPRQQPQSPQDAAFSRLDACIPKNEDQWQAARRDHGFETPEDVHTMVSALIQDRSLPPDLRRFVYIAVCCVERRKNEGEAFRNYRARTQTKSGDLTIRNYMTLVRGMIALMDRCYSIIQHRAFEALLLFGRRGIPTSLKDRTNTKKHLSTYILWATIRKLQTNSRHAFLETQLTSRYKHLCHSIFHL